MSSQHTLLPTASSREAWRGLRGLLRPRLGVASVTAVVLISGTVVAMVTPFVLGSIVDLVADGEDVDAITTPAVILVVLAALAAVLEMVGQWLVARVGEPAVADLREQVMGRAMELDLAQVEEAGTGDLVTRMTEDMQLVAEVARGVFTYFVSAALTIALTLVGLLTIDWRFALAGLCATPIQAWAVRSYVARASTVYSGERIARGELGQQLLDSIGGARTVRAYRLQPAHLGQIADRSLNVVSFSLRAVRMQTTFFARLNAAEFIGLSGVLVAGFFTVRSGAASIGEATAGALLFVRLFDPINIVLGLVDDMQEAGAGLARLIGITQLPKRPEPAEPQEPESGAVDIRQATFSYRPGHPVLSCVDVTMRAGERVAVVGASGAGKSTLAKLVAGVHRVDSGSILLGGADLDAMETTALRQTVGLMTQELHVFAGTVADDLRLVDADATSDDLWRVLELVGAGGWVRLLPDGLDTVVGEGGHRLNPTQVQQLGLARLALADLPIVILDEATAESGSAGARVLEAAAAKVLRGRTSLVVAHRLSQAAASDRIVVMDHGRVVEQGTHSELVATGGTYAELWSAWQTHRATEPE